MLVFKLIPLFAVGDETPLAYMFGVQAMPLWIVLTVALAAALFFGGRKIQNKPMRLASFVPLIICLFAGIQGVILIQDPIFYDYNDVTDKRVLVHWALVIAPIIAAAAVAWLEFGSSRRVSSRL